jgi:hypothetical protein
LYLVREKYERRKAATTGVGKLLETYNFFMNGPAAVDADVLRSLNGNFALYRPYFDNPKKVMVGEARVGSDYDVSAFSLRMRHSFPSGDSEDDLVEGHVIPVGSKVLLQGKFIGWGGGPFIIILRPMRHTDLEIRRAEGVLMTSASDYMPTSSAVLMLRSKLPVAVGVFDLKVFDTDLQVHLRHMLKRGFVEWK